MRLSHRFKEEDKIRFWIGHPYSILSRSNDKCSLHHIYSCGFDSADSILNSSMLDHVEHKEADCFNSGGSGSKEYRQQLLKLTLQRAVKIGWEFTEKDKEFLEYVKEDVQDVLN